MRHPWCRCSGSSRSSRGDRWNNLRAALLLCLWRWRWRWRTRGRNCRNRLLGGNLLGDRSLRCKTGHHRSRPRWLRHRLFGWDTGTRPGGNDRPTRHHQASQDPAVQRRTARANHVNIPIQRPANGFSIRVNQQKQSNSWACNSFLSRYRKSGHGFATEPGVNPGQPPGRPCCAAC